MDDYKTREVLCQTAEQRGGSGGTWALTSSPRRKEQREIHCPSPTGGSRITTNASSPRALFPPFYVVSDLRGDEDSAALALLFDARLQRADPKHLQQLQRRWYCFHLFHFLSFTTFGWRGGGGWRFYYFPESVKGHDGGTMVVVL